MLAVSAQWQEASKAQFRYQAYLYASLEVIPPGLRQGATVSSEDTDEHSDIDNIIDGIYGDPQPYATLERNRWLLNGTFNIIDDSTVFSDWWSKTAVSEAQPVIKFTFDKPYTFPGIFFKWDALNGTYPKSIQVVGYDATHTQQYSITVLDITSSEGFIDALAMDDVQYIDVTINTWVSEGWRARLLEVVFGLVTNFDSVNNGRIMSATQTSKADPINSSLPTHNFALTLRNYDKYFDPMLSQGISKYLAQQQVMRIQWAFITSRGNLEYAPEQVYLTEKFEIPSDSKTVNMNLTNRIALLDSDFYYGTYTGTSRTLKKIAEYILTKAKPLEEFEGQKPWVIPTTFENITTSAPIPAMATNALLQLIALAGCTWLTTRSEDGFIQFLTSQPTASDYCAVDEMQELGDPTITIKDRLRSVSIGLYNYSARETSEQVGKSAYTLSGTNVVTIKYSSEYATNVSAEVSGATLIAAEYYASYAILTVTALSTNANVEITLTGYIIYSTVSYLETYRDATVVDGMDVVIENPFITNVSHATQVAAYVENYYLLRNEYSISYIGYPQAEPGDKIDLTTIYGTEEVEIKNNTIEFNGGWSGTMEVV